MPPRRTALDVLDLILEEVTALSSAARTASTNSADQINYSARGLFVTLDVTAIAATPSITLHIQAKDSLSGNYEDLFVAAAAVTATGTHSYMLYPGVAAGASDVVETIGFALPRTWRIRVVHGDADSITYSVGCSYLA